MLPDATQHNPDPQYLRDLLREAGLTQRGAAVIMGISERTFRDYLNGNNNSKAPYPVQFALETLAKAS
jgi:transcriptional regulator with XRE-family HTH domain